MPSFIHDKRDPEEEFELLELLGEGSYGAVYRAERRADGAEVAVKIIPADNPTDLLKEVDFMMACSSPYIVRLHDSHYKDNEAWLTMEYVGGGSVSDILEVCRTTLSEAEARECTAWTVLALDYLHSNRKLHRDVKAGNILLTLDGRAKLADFGVSKEINTMANKAQTAIGTPYWMAPEVIQEVPYNGQADIWSLAITCIEMVEGNPPLHNVHPMRAIFMIPSKPSPKLSEPAKWSLEFNDFIARCLEKKPEDRPSSRAILRHPWVASSVKAIQEHSEVGSTIIRDLVAEHQPILKQFREEATTNANAGDDGDDGEDNPPYKTATLRRLSSSRGGDAPSTGMPFDSRSPEAEGSGETKGDTRGRTLGNEDDDDSAMDSSYSSGGSVIRVPVAGGGADEEDGYSSDGSVIRVPVADVDGQGEDGYSSDDSVVRVPIPSNSNIANGVNRGHRRENDCLRGGCYREVNGGEGKGRLCIDEGLEEKGEVACVPAKAMNTNLMAAARYFATSGGKAAHASRADVGGKQPRMGIEHVSRREQDNPQVKALQVELERLDISFTNDLARLRKDYEARKADLQAAIRACLDS